MEKCDRIITFSESKGTGTETTELCFAVLFRHLPRGTEENHRVPSSWKVVALEVRNRQLQNTLVANSRTDYKWRQLPSTGGVASWASVLGLANTNWWKIVSELKRTWIAFLSTLIYCAAEKCHLSEQWLNAHVRDKVHKITHQHFFNVTALRFPSWTK